MPQPLLPIRIDPHALLAALVAVSYTPKGDPEQTREAFRKALQRAGFVDETQTIAALAPKSNTPDTLFRGKGISVRFQSDGVVFNGIEGKKAENEKADEYIGWARYFSSIQEILELLELTGAVTNFPHTAVRYINALPDLPLNTQLRAKLPALGNLPAPSTSLYRATFDKVNLIEGGPSFEVELSLGDQQRVAGRTGKQSVFDITVRSHTADLNLRDLLRRLDEAHTCEKQVFFGLLDPSYLESLRPVYA